MQGKGRERKGKEGKGRERKGKEGKGRERKGKEERMGKEGKGRERKAERKADRKGKEGGKGMSGKEAAGDQRVWLRGRLRTAWLQGWLGMVGEKKPLEISELGCADGCGQEMGAENCANGRGRRGCNGVAGNGWGEEAAGDERAWLRGRLRTANGYRENCGAREWLEMGGEKKPLEISELGCADGCGREMGADNCADGCGRRGCNGVAGNGWGEEAAGDKLLQSIMGLGILIWGHQFGSFEPHIIPIRNYSYV